MFRENWCKISPDSWVLSIVNRGYKIEFSSSPPQRGLMKVTPVPTDPQKRTSLEEEILGLVIKRAIHIVPPENSQILYRSSFFLAPKKPNLWRPILNLKPLNKRFIKPKRFRMETLATIIPTLTQGMWATSIDLKDAYLHIPIHPDYQHYLAFRYKHVDYEFEALPFGLATAPRVFTRVTRSVLAYLRRQGITLFAYLDDWLILAPSEAECSHSTSFVIQVLQDLGWVINLEKSNLQPSQNVVYLGAHLDFCQGVASPTQERIVSLCQTTTQLLSTPSPRARLWLRLLGLAASLVEILPYCRLQMRPIQFYLLRHFKPSLHPLSLRVSVSDEVRPFLLWWTEPSNLSKGRPFVDSRPTVTITTDASNSGWGATRGTSSTAGLWSPAEKLLHINVLELIAVKKAIHFWANDLRDSIVEIFSDNSTTVAYLNRQGGTRSLRLCRETWDLLHFCQCLNITVRATHLAGSQNILADALSRGLFNHHEWSLNQKWADFLFQTFGRPHIDLFASHLNNKLTTFCSRRPHPKAWASDALSLNWDGLLTYAFPPLPLLQRVLLKLRRSRAMMILVAPFWPRQPWFPLILQMLVDLPLRLPQDPYLLSQRGGRILHPDLRSLDLVAWKLSTDASILRGFHEELLILPPTPGEVPQLRLTIPDWRSTTPGHEVTLSIPWRRQ